jgi:hypothetical protein
MNARNEYHRTLASAKSNFVTKSINKVQTKADPRQYWHLVNTLIGRKKDIILPDIPHGILVDKFNQFFNEKVLSIRNSISSAGDSAYLPPRQLSQVLESFGQISGADLVQILRSLKVKPNKLDILPHWLFKDNVKVLMPILVCFVNLVLKHGIPLVHKHSIITPLLKGSSLDVNDISNYRPVANFPTLVKVVEKVIATKIINHLNVNHLWDPNQSAYRPHHSCETVILSVLNDIYTAMDQNEVSIAVLLDMSAAFDTVDHNILLMKLENLGIRGDALEWLRMYLD